MGLSAQAHSARATHGWGRLLVGSVWSAGGAYGTCATRPYDSRICWIADSSSEALAVRQQTNRPTSGVNSLRGRIPAAVGPRTTVEQVTITARSLQRRRQDSVPRSVGRAHGAGRCQGAYRPAANGRRPVIVTATGARQRDRHP